MRWSLIVATLGRTEPVDALLASLSRQSVTTFRVILVDQNGDDRLVPIVASWRDRLDLVHLRIPPRGVSQARNAGIALIGSADFVAFPDDDCVYEADTLERAEALFAQAPQVEAILGTWVILTDPPRSDSGTDLRASNVTRIGCLRQSPTFVLFFRRSAVIDAGGFDESLGPGAGTPWLCGEDTDFLLRAGGLRGSAVRTAAVRVRHPSVDATAVGYERKAFGYGRGRMRLLRKHGFPAWVELLHLLHPLVGSVVSRRSDRGFRWHLLRGRWQEWRTPWCAPVLADPAAGLREGPSSTLLEAGPGDSTEGVATWCLIVATVERTEELDRLLRSLQVLRNGAGDPLGRRHCRIILLDQNQDGRLDPILARWQSSLTLECHRIVARGVAQARNAGLALLRGEEFVAFPDDDCFYEPMTLALVEGIFRGHQAVGVICGRLHPSGDVPGPVPLVRAIDVTLANRYSLLHGAGMPLQFYRRAVTQRVGAFDVTLGPGGGTPWFCGEDSDFLIRAAQAGHRVVKSDVVRVFHPTVDSVYPGYQAKAFGYGRGRMRLLRKHGYPRWFQWVSILHPLLGCVIGPASSRGFRWHLFRGRLAEWWRPHRLDRP